MNKLTRWSILFVLLVGTISTAQAVRSSYGAWSFADTEHGTGHSLRYHGVGGWGGWQSTYSAQLHRFEREDSDHELFTASGGVATDIWITPLDDQIHLLLGARLEHIRDWEMGVQARAHYSVQIAQRSIAHPIYGFAEVTLVPFHGGEQGGEFRAGLRTPIAMAGVGALGAFAYDPNELYGGNRWEVGLFWQF